MALFDDEEGSLAQKPYDENVPGASMSQDLRDHKKKKMSKQKLNSIRLHIDLSKMKARCNQDSQNAIKTT